MRRPFLKLATSVGTVGLLVPLGSLGLLATSSGASSSSVIKIGLIVPETGVLSTIYTGAKYGAIARVDAQNAAGGVDGHKLDLVIKDTTSTPTGNKTAAQELVENTGVFGVINVSGFAYGGNAYLTQAGVPTTGVPADGNEWAQPPNTNLFSAQVVTGAKYSGKSYYYDSALVKFLKSKGVTKLAEMAYTLSPSSVQAAEETLSAAKSDAGIATCYNNTTVPYGTISFTSDVLSMKSAGCNGVVTEMIVQSNIGVSQGLTAGGVKAVQLYATGYTQSVLDTTSVRHSLDGDYFTSAYNFTTPNSATEKMLSDFEKVDPSYHKGEIPSYGLPATYVAADLMITGLEMAGKSPSRQTFISKLRNDCSYTAGGLMDPATPLCHFGTTAMLPKQQCTWVMQLTGNHFIVANGGKPLCSVRQAETS